MADIFPFLRGPAFAAVLHPRGVLLLHGAAVVNDDCAVLVSGHSNMGKSTLTAVLVSAGLPLLTEDLTPLMFSDNEFLIQPGYPGLQLHADAITAMNFSLEDYLPRISGLPPGRQALA
jgi:hypothetical protein